MINLKNLFYHFFIPNEKNNYRAKFLHTNFLLIYLVIAFVLNFYFKKLNINNVLGFATDITIQKLYELTNKEREKRGLNPLNYNEKLAKAAYEKAQDMLSKGYWAHFAPDGTTPWYFILKNGYQYEYAGENLAKNFLFSNNVVSAWMQSPSHRENILKKEYTDIGFAVVNGVLNGEETTLVVQMFASPLYSNENKQIENQKIIQENKEKNENKNLLASAGVLAEKTKKNKLPALNIAFKAEIVFFIFLIIAVISDFYFAEKFGILRIEAKNIAHLIFIFFILIGLLIISKGAIL